MHWKFGVLLSGLILVAVTAMSLSSTAIGQGTPPSAGPLNDLQTKLQEIQATLNTLSGGTDLSSLKMQLNLLESSVSNLTTNVGNLQNQVDAVQKDVDNLSAEVRGVVPIWDAQLDSRDGCKSDRFTCIWDDLAVRDNETGLVWDREPEAGAFTWNEAIIRCADRKVGGRKGFHLPMKEQLATLVDTSNSNPALPTGHPFLNVQLEENYWAATSTTFLADVAWDVDLSDGDVIGKNKSNTNHVWCVRGGQSFDGNTHNTLH